MATWFEATACSQARTVAMETIKCRTKGLPISLSLTPLLPRSKGTFSRPFKAKCIRDMVRIGSIIIFHLSKLWKAKFLILRDVICLVKGNLLLITHFLARSFYSSALVVASERVILSTNKERTVGRPYSSSLTNQGSGQDPCDISLIYTSLIYRCSRAPRASPHYITS